MYGIGFLVLTIHHASFGIPLIGFLRPKIIAAGTLFSTLAVIPVVVWLLSHRRNKRPQVQRSFRDHVEIWSEFLLEALGISLAALRAIFVQSSVQPFGYYGWPFAALIVSSAVLALPWWSKWGNMAHAAKFIGVYGWVAFCLYKTHDKTLTLLVGWFLLCGYLAYAAQDAFANPRSVRTVGWIHGVMGNVGAVAYFAVLLYPGLPSAYCGGAPVPVTFQFPDKAAPIGNSSQLKAWLLDETDAGFYFVQEKESKKAVFIPRSTVIAVYYGER